MCEPLESHLKYVHLYVYIVEADHSAPS